MASKKYYFSMVPLLLYVALLSLVPSASVIHAKVTHNQQHNLFPNKRQGQYINSLSSYDIIKPIKVTESGGFLSHDLTHAHISNLEEWAESKKRKRREIERGIDKKSNDNLLHYSVSLDGVDHIVHLEPNHLFLAPHAVVETRNSSGLGEQKIGNTTSRIGVIGSSPRCHYIGHVANHTSSKVALSTCDGLHGFVKTDFDEFLIEPIKGHERSKDEPHPHLVYRKSSLPQSDPPEEGNHKDEICSSKHFEEALNERARWEDEVRRTLKTNYNKLNKAKSRRKRSVSLERNVEVLVVADKKMIEYYANEDLNTYILTVMNMVSSIFHDSSIGNAVNIIIVRIMLLETPQYEEELYISHDADETLGSFCKWQQMVNPSSENHPHHHDVAVLLTRYNICSRINDHCSTLGLAEIAGMCQMHRSCNVNEDTGLQIAYTIAHEIGHNFGMNHDGTVNGCGSAFGMSAHVMSPHLASDSLPITWSNCSRFEITKFLDRDWGNCLEDEPQEVEYNFPELPPGAMYDASHQCRLIYGPTAEQCREMEIECDTLWCKVNDRCVTRLESAAEGTQCGKHKWCSAGKCVTMGDRPTSIHGSWGQWSSWSSCSRSCGAGVEVATRHCDNPAPSNGGKYCTGDRRRYRICNTQDCPADDEPLRALQCTEFDNVPHKGKNYTWRPVTIERSPCQLHCIPGNEFYSVELKDTVVDGTPCKPGTRDMCIHGVCKRVACDWTIEGTAQEDRCGLCHGDGTQCVTTKGTYMVTEDASYVSVVTFPIGARNVRVEEMGDAANYLAIRDHESGRYHLNGNWIIQWSGEYSADGVMIYYKRSNETESMFMPGPVKRPLTLMLLFQTKNPGLRWEYTLPHENATYTPEFHWQFSDWTFCTHTCGGGSQLSKPQCMEKEAGLVEDRYCHEIRPQEKQRECNIHPCPAWWWSGPWQPCSITCGSSGTKRRTVICVRSYGPAEQMALMDSDCILEDKPHEEEECHDLMPCPSDSSWTVGPWIESCRGDPCEYERRDVKCNIANGICNMKTRPLDFRQCGNITCGYWETREWAECSTTCGDGVQIRDVLCVGGSACIRVDEPGSVKECHLSECQAQQLLPYQEKGDTFKTVLETLEIHVDDIEGEKSSTQFHSNNSHSNIIESDISNENKETVVSTSETSQSVSSSSEAPLNEMANLTKGDILSNNSVIEEGNNVFDNQSIDEGRQGTFNSSENSKNLTQHPNDEPEKGVDPRDKDLNVFDEIRGNITISPKENVTSNEGETQNVETNYLNNTSINSTNDNLSVSPKSLGSELSNVDNNEIEDSKKGVDKVNDKGIAVENGKEANMSKEATKTKKAKDESFIDYAVPDDYYDPVDSLDEQKDEEREEPSNNKNRDKETIKHELKNTEIDIDKNNTINLEIGGNSVDEINTNVKDNNKTIEKIKNVTQVEFSSDVNQEKDATESNDKSDEYDDYEYENDVDEDDDYNDTSSAESEEERPQGFVDDKIDVEGVQVIEIIDKKESEKKKHNKKGKKVKIHTGADAIKIINRISKKANKGKSAEFPLNQSASKEEDDHEMMPSAKWTLGPWSKCSEPCGGGTEHRAVECHNTSTDSIAPPWKCHTLPPPDMQHCNMFKCLNWTISEYGPCSATCGDGVRLRNATCPAEGRCHSKDLPPLQEVCVTEPCVKWVEGPWSMCTKSCGGGYQIRFVKCVDIRTQEASQDCVEDRPPHKKMCNVVKCQQERQSQQNHCKDHMDTKLCRRLVNMCSTKFIKAKCCRTCLRKGN